MSTRGKFVVRDAEWWADNTMPEPNTGCHLYLGFLCPQGYGRISYNGKGGVLIHRVRYEQVFGPFDPALKVCHRCDVPSCVNPDHLFLGTQKENLRDMFAKGRGRPFGEPFDGTNWRIPKDGAA